jgi:hypothetical protein
MAAVTKISARAAIAPASADQRQNSICSQTPLSHGREAVARRASLTCWRAPTDASMRCQSAAEGVIAAAVASSGAKRSRQPLTSAAKPRLPAMSRSASSMSAPSSTPSAKAPASAV